MEGREAGGVGGRGVLDVELKQIASALQLQQCALFNSWLQRCIASMTFKHLLPPAGWMDGWMDGWQAGLLICKYQTGQKLPVPH